jgi:hypothetical protein
VYVDGTRSGGDVISNTIDVFGGDVIKSPAISAKNWNLPVEGGVMVLAAQGADDHELGEELDMQLLYYPRYLSYR